MLAIFPSLEYLEIDWQLNTSPNTPTNTEKEDHEKLEVEFLYDVAKNTEDG